MTTQPRRAASDRRAARLALVAGGVAATGAALAVTGTSAVLASMLVTLPREQADDVAVLGLDERGVR
ncbi:hypothetical protein, partial [Agrococcus sp. HG114]|uniref:hypothetical protein n=1 Tax=Agrococcus sp. HG114 TaxID=2969757 RepID=UPI00215B03C5